MVDWRNVSLLGIDVGFSSTQKTTGIAIYNNGKLTDLCCVGSSAKERHSVVTKHGLFDAVAIDGPFLPAGTDLDIKRHAERLLIGRGFHDRCKPGMSHFGTGFNLRMATKPIADECYLLTKGTPPHSNKQNRQSALLVEAFPNAFLGVLLDDIDYESIGRVPRGAKFDRIYERAVTANRLDRLLQDLSLNNSEVSEAIESEASKQGRETHERRAALVCLLTAAIALVDEPEYVGDVMGGWICLPPQRLWARWAQDALTARVEKLGRLGV